MPKLYIAAPVDTNAITGRGKRYGAHYLNFSTEELQMYVGVFGSKSEAENFCRYGASVNGGIEMGIFECTEQFFAKPAKVARKVWKGSELLVAE